ncbi:hypothetical protein L9Z73_27440, partial [Pseudomonas sp. TNT11]|nr:hypothetical protein [Pseudomonas emilianonis]
HQCEVATLCAELAELLECCGQPAAAQDLHTEVERVIQATAAKGCHQLIRDGAVLVETIEHILEGLRGWQALSRPAPLPVTHPLVALLHAAPHTSEALAIASGRPLSQVLATLTELELEGQVVCESGRWLARC